MDILERALAQPITHNVVCTYQDGSTYEFGARSLKAAESYARGEGRKIGRDLISRKDGSTVRIVSVEIKAV